MATYAINPGTRPGAVELTFAAKPAEEVREALKTLKFRWNGKKGVWYGFSTAEEVAQAIGNTSEAMPAVKPQKAKIPARVPSLAPIKFYYNGIKVGSGALIRCFYSLPSKEGDPVRIYAKGYGDDLPAGYLLNVENDTDSMTDYFETDRAKVGKDHPLYKYIYYNAAKAQARQDRPYCDKLRESIANIEKTGSEPWAGHLDNLRKDLERRAAFIAEFDAMKDPGQPTAADLLIIEDRIKEAEEKEARERENEERERAIASELARVRHEYEEKQIPAILESVIVEDIPEEARPRLTGLVGGIGKECSAHEVRETIAEGHGHTDDAVIARRVTFPTSEGFELFSNNLLRDWDFLRGMGGSATDDPRVNSMAEWSRLAPSQRDQVKWYIVNAVAIYEGDTLRLVIDPQGYDYARYTYIAEGAEEAPKAAEEYKEFYIPAPIEEQAQNLTEGEEITLLTVDAWIITITPKRGRIESVRVGSYAQYKSALFLSYTPEGRRKAQNVIITEGQEALIFSGILPDVPRSMREKPTASPGMVECMDSGINAKDFLHNCSEYYKAQGYTALVDTIPA